MADSLPISDLHIFPLSRQDGRLVILHDTDHLLRRFGVLETLSLEPGASTPFNLRAEADQILAPLDGAVDLSLMDMRVESPSHGARAEITLSAADPQGLLLPFGVACRMLSADGARLLRLSTHSAAHASDRDLADGYLPEAAPQ
jgi:hypothetical protein